MSGEERLKQLELVPQASQEEPAVIRRVVSDTTSNRPRKRSLSFDSGVQSSQVAESVLKGNSSPLPERSISDCVNH